MFPDLSSRRQSDCGGRPVALATGRSHTQSTPPPPSQRAAPLLASAPAPRGTAVLMQPWRCHGLPATTLCHPSCVDHRGGRECGRGGGDHCGGGRHARQRGRLGPPSPTSRREARLNCFNNFTRTHRRTRERVSWMCWTVNTRASKCISPCRIRTRTHSLWAHVLHECGSEFYYKLLSESFMHQLHEPSYGVQLPSARALRRHVAEVRCRGHGFPHGDLVLVQIT